MDSTTHSTGRVNRRLAFGGGLAAATALAWPRPQIKGRAVIQRGIAGGGTVQLDGGEAHFSVGASSLAGDEDEQDPSIFLGRVHWVDATAGVTLVSTAITDYQNTTSGEGEDRRIRGTMSANGEGEHPFVMDLHNGGDPGAGQDFVSLAVGVGAGVGEAATPEADLGFSYAAEGELVSGDLETADFAVGLDTGEVTDPGPAN